VVGETDLDGLPVAGVELSPEFYLRASGISDDAIRAFADEFRISNRSLLRQRLP
jgi:hypothetical protein